MSLADKRPDVAAQWDPDANADVTPAGVGVNSTYEAGWVCEHGHTWREVVERRTRRRSATCPQCPSEHPSVAAPRPGASLAEKRPDLAAQWDHEANGDLTPVDVSPGSGYRAAWVCENGHRWQATITSRTHGSGCPACYVQRPRESHVVRVRPGRALAENRPDLAAQWDHDANGPFTPANVSVGSNRLVGWVCEHGHTWQEAIIYRVRHVAPCPTCVPRRRYRSSERRLPRRPKPGQSLAERYPDLAAQWDHDANDGLTPADVSYGAGYRAAWVCPRGHRWRVTVNNRTTSTSASSGCPQCSRGPQRAEDHAWRTHVPTACSHPGCDQRAVSQGLCGTHRRWATLGVPEHTRAGQPSGYGTYGRVDRDAGTVTCHECGRGFQRLELHIQRSHEMTVADYRARHGLAASEPLLCQTLIDRLREASLQRVGSPAWRRLEAARDANREASLAAARAAATGKPRPASAPVSVPTRARKALRCTVCGRPAGETSRGRQTCSPECWQESKARAAGRREAARRGEPDDFTARPGTGPQLRFAEVVARLGLNPVTVRRHIRDGKLPTHAGRQHGVAFWWTSDLEPTV